MTDVVVAGGGLAGLVGARRLAEDGADVTLFERRDEIGGRVRTREVGGYTIDRGFQVLFTAYPAVRRELDVEALEPREFSPGATIARPGERSVLADPLGDPAAAVETLFNREVRLADKLRVLRLRRELARSDLETITDSEASGTSIRAYLVDRGFSTAFVENFAAPFYGGITLDRSLSTDAAVFEYTFRMLGAGRTIVPADGMGEIPTQLTERARRAGATIETDAAVEDIDPHGEDHDGSVTVETGTETITADAAVVATDPATARDLTGAESIPTAARSCVTQYVTLPSGSAPETGRRIVLNAADDRPNQIAPLSAVAPEYAPDSRELYSATFLGAQEETDEQLFEEVRDALSSWYPEARFGELELLTTDRIEFAQFDQPPGFSANLPAPDAPDGPVVLAGDYTRWSSIQGAMESGRVAAETVSGWL